MNLKPILLLIACIASGIMFSQDAKQLTQTCSACHGNEGVSASPAFPNLAGQTESYTYQQLKRIQSGERSIPTMAGQLDRLSDQDLKAIAAFYSTKPQALNIAKDENLELGRSLYKIGHLGKGIPACSACHGPAGKGLEGPKYPALAGQWSDYIAASLLRYETDSSDGSAQIMKTIALKLNSEERKAVANYIQGLRN